MKKIMMALLLFGSLALMNKAGAQRVTYYYYPDANVYYNTHTHEYAYADNDNWRYDKDLPSTYKLNKRYVTVYGTSDRDEIWRDNQMHREKYKDYGKRDLKRDFKREKKEDKHEIKKEKREEKRELKRDQRDN